MSEFVNLDITLDVPRFLSLLKSLISETQFLQNNPVQGLIPKEDLAAEHVLKALEPYSKKNGGPLEVEVLNFINA